MGCTELLAIVYLREHVPYSFCVLLVVSEHCGIEFGEEFGVIKVAGVKASTRTAVTSVIASTTVVIVKPSNAQVIAHMA